MEPITFVQPVLWLVNEIAIHNYQLNPHPWSSSNPYSKTKYVKHEIKQRKRNKNRQLDDNNTYNNRYCISYNNKKHKHTMYVH